MKLDRRAALRAGIGFLLALGVWAALSQPYDALLAKSATAIIRAFERPAVTTLTNDGQLIVVNRSDFDPRSKAPALSADDLTFNVIILVALFALEQRPMRDRNIRGLAIALVILMLVHVFAVIVEVMSIYVAKLGPWSTVHYSDFERNAWGVAYAGYRTVLMYAIPFGLWWAFRAPETAETRAAKPKTKRAKKK